MGVEHLMMLTCMNTGWFLWHKMSAACVDTPSSSAALPSLLRGAELGDSCQRTTRAPRACGQGRAGKFLEGRCTAKDLHPSSRQLGGAVPRGQAQSVVLALDMAFASTETGYRCACVGWFWWNEGLCRRHLSHAFGVHSELLLVH